MARYTTLNFTTSSVTSGGGTLIDSRTVGNDFVNIYKIKVVPSTGSGGTNEFQVYSEAAASTLLYTTGEFTGTWYDPEDNDGSTSVEAEEGFVIPYEDDDSGSQIHFKFINNDSVSKTYTVTVIYEEPMISGVPVDQLIIDTDDAEALLVRKDGDVGDVFVVDTVNTRVGIGGTPSQPFHLQGTGNIMALIQDSGANSIPRLRLENDAQIWELRLDGGNSDRIAFHDITAGSSLFYVDKSSGDTTIVGDLTVSGTGLHSFIGDVKLDSAQIGGSVDFSVRNSDNSNSGSNARIYTQVGGTSAGDPKFQLTIAGAVDWTIGLDNSDSDLFKIGSNATVGTNTHLTINSSGDTTIAGDLTVSGTGPHAIGGSPVGRFQYNQTGSFTGDGSAATLIGFHLDPTLTGASGDNTFQTGMRVNASITTQDNSDTIALVTQLTVEEPQITKGATDTITLAATQYIAGAPTEGTTNAALYVNSGTSHFGDNIILFDGGTDRLVFNGDDRNSPITPGIPAYIYTTGGSGSAPFDAFGGIVYQARGDSGARGGHHFYVNTTPILAMSIDNGGRVGIQESAPAKALHITANPATIRLEHSSNSLYTTDFIQEFADQAFRIEVGGTAILRTIGFNDADELGLGVKDHTDALYIDTNGKVGIGISSSIDGQTHIKAGATGTVGLVVEALSGASADAMEIHYNGTETTDLIARSSISAMRHRDRDLGNNVRGAYYELARNTNAGTEGPAAGAVTYVEAAGTRQHTWADNTGDLRIHTSAPTGSSGSPTVSDTAGNVVGDQTSWHELKSNITPFTDYESALEKVLATDLSTFDMARKNHMMGLVINEEDIGSWYSINDDLSKDQIPALDERTIIGHLVASVKALEARIAELES